MYAADDHEKVSRRQSTHEHAYQALEPDQAVATDWLSTTSP